MSRSARTQKGFVGDEQRAQYSCGTDFSVASEDLVLERAAAIVEARMLRQSSVLVAPEAFHPFLMSRLAGLVREEFIAFWLDNKHRIIAIETLAIGSINAGAVYPREVVRSALRHNAAAVAFAHNHPSGDPTPSLADLEITLQLQAALELFDVRLLDHFVVGGSGIPISMSQDGWMWPPEAHDAAKKSPKPRRAATRKRAAQ
jgi:DNA repair protein RadC